jgi:acyl carrier protein phosphodiesterase
MITIFAKKPEKMFYFAKMFSEKTNKIIRVTDIQWAESWLNDYRKASYINVKKYIQEGRN